MTKRDAEGETVASWYGRDKTIEDLHKVCRWIDKLVPDTAAADHPEAWKIAAEMYCAVLSAAWFIAYETPEENTVDEN